VTSICHPQCRTRGSIIWRGLPTAPQFTLDDLDFLHEEGVRTLIITGSEGKIDYPTFKAQITATLGGVKIIDLSRRWADVNVFFELGNEPDRVYLDQQDKCRRGDPKCFGPDPEQFNAVNQRQKALATSRQFIAEYAGNYPNFRLMISLPTLATLGTTATAARQYFDTFLATGIDADAGKRVGLEFSAVAVHAYATDCLRAAGTAAQSSPGTKAIDIVRAAIAASNRPVYVTESGIASRVDLPPTTGGTPQGQYASYQAKWEETGKRYVDGLAGFDLPDGRIRGVTYFQTALADLNPEFHELNIDGNYRGDDQGNALIGALPGLPAHTIMGQRDRAVHSGCYQAQGDRQASPIAAAFADLYGYTYGFAAINDLAARRIARGYGDGRYGPADTALRAQMAALIARAMGWEGENWGTPFSDQNGVDDALWRHVGTLAHYNVAQGYPGGTFDPTGPVLKAQAVSFVTRAMVAKGFWQYRPDDPAMYPNVPGTSGHRVDLSTYAYYVGTVPGTSSARDRFSDWDQPASRAAFALVLDKALTTSNALGPAPTIAGFTPSRGPAGTVVTITGRDFAPAPTGNAVTINGVPTTVSAASATSLTAIVPAATGSGRVAVDRAAGQAISADDFAIPPSPYGMPDLAVVDRLTPGLSKAVSIPAAGRVGLLLFDGVAGERVRLQVANAFCCGDIVVRQPDGAILRPAQDWDGYVGFTEPFALPATGTYAVVVDPRDSAIGTLNVTLHHASDATGSLVPGGTSFRATLTAPGQRAALTFRGSAGQRVSLRATGVTIAGAAMSIRTADGSVLGSTGLGIAGGFLEPLALPTTGTYTVLLDADGDLVGGATLQLYSVVDVMGDMGSVSPTETTTTVAITIPGQSARSTFGGGQGQRINLQIANINFGPDCALCAVVAILRPDGTTLITTRVGPNYAVLPRDRSPQDPVSEVYYLTLPVAGQYTVVVDPDGSRTGGVDLMIKSDPAGPPGPA